MGKGILFFFLTFLLFAKTLYAGETLNIILAGDTHFGESYRIPEEFSEPDGGPGLYDGSVENLSSILLSADWTVVNLETPLTLPLTDSGREKPIFHWARPFKTAETLKRYGVRSVGLANNHTLDYGTRGLDITLKTLRQSDIIYFGAGHTAAEASRPLEKSFHTGEQEINVAIFPGFGYRRSYDERYRFYATDEEPGVALLDPEKAAVEFEKIRRNNPDTIIIVYPHWGSNYRWRSASQQKTAHHLIDAGADLIIGHGAHMFQQVERYREKWVVYGLGNFVFNSPGRYGRIESAHPYSLIAMVILEPEDKGFTGEVRLYPIMSDNRRTGYKSRFVSGEEFLEVLALLEQNCKPWGLPSLITTGADRFGPFLSLPLEKP